MRIAHFCHRYPPALGGSESYFARLSVYLASQGDTVEVWTTNALALDAFYNPKSQCLPPGLEQRDGVLVRRFPLWHLPFGHRYVMKLLSLAPWRHWQALTMPYNPVSLDMFRNSVRPPSSFDIVHATAFPYSFPLLCARRLARCLGIPFLLTPFVHTGDPENFQDRTRRAYTTPALIDIARSADRVFVQTQGERDELLRHGLDKSRLVLQGLGVDADACSGGDRASARRQWGVTEDTVVVGHLANNSVEKGTVDLLRAASLGWKQKVPFRLVLAGPQMPNFLRFWESFLSERDNVTLLGPLSDSQRRDFYAAIDVFALPSRSDSFGLVFPEAWSVGVPSVAYRAGGVPWVIRNGVDGILVRCGDVEALAQALTRLVTDKNLRRCLGESGRARISSDFNWYDKLSLVREIYTQVSKITHRHAR